MGGEYSVCFPMVLLLHSFLGLMIAKSCPFNDAHMEKCGVSQTPNSSREAGCKPLSRFPQGLLKSHTATAAHACSAVEEHSRGFGTCVSLLPFPSLPCCSGLLFLLLTNKEEAASRGKR